MVRPRDIGVNKISRTGLGMKKRDRKASISYNFPDHARVQLHSAPQKMIAGPIKEMSREE